jgi:tetratricopeptide (TPR) repeat protein/S1-C subfamily serine protease
VIFYRSPEIMYRSAWLVTAALVGTNIALVQPAAVALSAGEIFNIAKAVTVEIRLQQDRSVGSGIIIDRQGDLYTLITNRHVVCGGQLRDKVPAGESYDLSLVDGRHYRVKDSSVKLVGRDLDLAIIQFRSKRNYAVAKVTTNNLQAADKVYTSGFPPQKPGFNFNEGKTIAVVTKRLTGDFGGYTIIYDADTLPGMSGGGVFNSAGLLVAIHGLGGNYGENTLLSDDNDNSQVGTKIGLNRGIPVRWVVQNLRELGINLTTLQSMAAIGTDRQRVAANTADEHFITGFNKLVDPGENVLAGKRQAAEEFTIAIKLNPKYASAYRAQALVYYQLQDFQKALLAYDAAIALDPKSASTYENRGFLKYDKLSDAPGALADLNQAIALDPKSANAYENRGLLKYKKLNDISGSLADLSRAIALNPGYARIYSNRGVLKYEKLNDISGALADYDRAIALNPKYASAYSNRGLLKNKKLNDVRGALADYDRAIALNPKYANAYYNRGLLKNEKLNDVRGALTDYDRAISLDPNSVEAHVNRANLKANRLNDFRGALVDYDRAITLDPKSAIAYINRGILKNDKLNDISGALADYNRAIALSPKSAEAYYSRANLKAYQLNDLRGALVDYDRAIDLNPKYATAYNNRAFLKHEKLNDIRGALTDFDRAIALDPKFALAYNNRAFLKHKKLNDSQGAIQDFRKAAQIFRSQGQTQQLQTTIEFLRQLGATE